jgi:hypothetical protein
MYIRSVATEGCGRGVAQMWLGRCRDVADVVGMCTMDEAKM